MAQTKNVNMTPNDTLPRLRLSQYDVGRELAFKLCDGALSYTVPTGATVKLMGTKPSGFGFTESCTVSGNTASISTTAGMTDEWGAVVCELVVEKSGVRLGSTNLLLVVEKSPHPEGTIDGSQESVIPELTVLVERVEAAAASVNNLTVSATTLAAGSDATAVFDEDTDSIAFGIPRGADGEVTQAQLDAAVTDLKSDITSLADTNVNLFDKDSEDTVTGAFLRDGSPVSGDRYFYTNYFSIKPGDTVITKYSSNLGASQLTLYNSSKTYINKVSGVRSGDYVTYTVPTTTYYLSAAYGRVNNEDVNMATLMVVKGSTYPSEYKPFGQVILNPPVPLTSTQKSEVQDMIDAGEYINLPNVLYQKKVVFDGDSICAGVSAGDDRSGWAGIIGTANSMDWHNEGATGATIAYISGRHCISRNIDLIYASYPTLDYLILEGGCNDADILYQTELPFGTLSLSDYNSTFDDTTFTGALESLFQNAVNKYPTTKIGFIITQKMGTSYAGYDADHSRYRAFYERIIEVCKKWGIPYIDLWTVCPLNPRMPAMYSSQMTPQENIDAGHAYIDGQHLTPTGYDVITPYIEAWMRTL